MSAVVKTFVESAIAENSIILFTKSYCKFCKRAKALFKFEFPDVPTRVIELDEREDGAAIQNYLLKKTGQRTVPNIFINQKHVGGCDDVVSLSSQGKLSKLVNQ